MPHPTRIEAEEVAQFIHHYRANKGFVRDKKYLQNEQQIKEKWVPIVHALDALYREARQFFNNKELPVSKTKSP